MNNDYVKTNYIQYKVYKKGISIKKASVCNRFSSGILIFTDHGSSITVHCRVIVNHTNEVGRTVKEICDIPLSPSKTAFRYLCFIPLNSPGKKYTEVSNIIHLLNSSHGYRVNCGFFAKRKTAMDKSLAMIIGAPLHHIEKLADEYNIDFILLEGKEKKDMNDNSTSHGNQMASSDSSNNRSVDPISAIRHWVGTHTFKEFCSDIEARVKGQKNLSLMLLEVYMYLEKIANNRLKKAQNICIVGPSGCGKTESIRALREYFISHIGALAFPVLMKDTSLVTSEGYAGKSTEYLIQGLNHNGIGIVALDELEKRLVPDTGNTSNENVNKAIQGQLLTLLEGSTAFYGIDTRKTMFIGLAAFEDLRDRRASELKIGFGVDVERNTKADYFADISRDDMVSYGALAQFIGRFSSIISFGPISTQALNEVIDLRLNEIAQEYNIIIDISEHFRLFLRDNATSKYGLRLVESLIREEVNAALVDVYLNDISISKLTITDQGKFEFEQLSHCSSLSQTDDYF